MGNGKGNPEYYVAEIQPGKVLYEMDGVDEALAREAFRAGRGQAADRDDVRASAQVGAKQKGHEHERPGTARQETPASSTRSCCDLLKAQFGLRMQQATQQLDQHQPDQDACAARSPACETIHARESEQAK